MEPLILTPSDFVGLLNQTLEFAYPVVSIVGELSNFKVSKNRWVYFDLKDDLASIKFFGTVYQLPGPLEDGLKLQVQGSPRLHPTYGFSLTISSIKPVGEGSIKKAAALLRAKLAAEGLFEPSRKRLLPYPPSSIGLITSSESAAYHDFVKVLGERWGGINIDLADVQVQGEIASSQIATAIEYFNQHADPPDIIVLTRGGGSIDDLAVYSTEQVTRAVAGSRVPTLVAIGHEIDISLSELAADQRASTPSNAAVLLTPEKNATLAELGKTSSSISLSVQNLIGAKLGSLLDLTTQMKKSLHNIFIQAAKGINSQGELLTALNPAAVLSRGYAIVRSNGKILRSSLGLKKDAQMEIELIDSVITAQTKGIRLK